MREILFRAKHIHALPQNERLEGRWIEGYLSDKSYINSTELKGEFLVDPETVCQYTGLADKNGQKIFEGDIIRGKAKTPYVVEYKEKIAGFVAKNRVASSAPCMNYGTMLSYEVIGNIFDNPETFAIK